MQKNDTRTEILSIARDIVATEGVAGVSFDAIARRLGRSKQAVLYWYPSRNDLLAALFLPWLEAEAEVATVAVADVKDEAAAVAAFIQAVATFHFTDLERFRTMYLAPQITRGSASRPQAGGILDEVHPVTDRLYSALADKLDDTPGAARQKAAAIHAAVLGVVLMFALADAVNDPLKHSQSDMVDALIAFLGAR